MHTSPLRWGILGAANVARKNWRAIHLTGNAVVTGVASRDPLQARKFVEECQAEVPFATLPRAYATYEELLASPEVDAVYVPLPTGPRKEWLLRAAAAGKHVIGEKPCAASTADLVEVLEACRSRGLQFMDGVMFHHSARTARIVELIRDGQALGEIRRVAAQFSFCAPEDFAASNIRADVRLEPQGCVGDLGWYCLRFILLALGGTLPETVVARQHATLRAPGAPAGVPAEVSGELFFPGGVTASFYCSFRALNQQWAHVSGTRGHLSVPDFVLPYDSDTLSFDVHQPEFAVRGCEFRMLPHARHHTVPEASHGAAASPEVNLFRNFSAAVLSGQLHEGWPEIALRTQILLDAVMQSLDGNGREITVPPRPSRPLVL